MGATQNSGAGGGIAMYTHVGKKPFDESLAFFRPVTCAPSTPCPTQYELAAAANFTVQWLMRPWSGACSGANCDDRINVLLVARQAVKTARYPTGTQLQQGFGFFFTNTACSRPDAVLCQLQVNPTAMCAGINCGGEVYINENDPFVAGRLGAENAATSSSASDGSRSVWTSRGSATLVNQTFESRDFRAEITWTQFANMLRIVTKRRVGCDDDNCVRMVFGSTWKARSNWALTGVNVSQGVYDPNFVANRTYVGGHVSKLMARARCEVGAGEGGC